MIRSFTLFNLKQAQAHTQTVNTIKQSWKTQQIRFFSNTFKNYNEEKGFTETGQQQKEEEKDIRQAILKATLEHVPTYGWSMESMHQGAKQLGYPAVIHGVFPGGPIGLIDAYLQDCQRQFNGLMKKNNNDEAQQQYWHPQANMTEKIRALTILRLNMLKPYAHRWPEAVAILASPTNVPIGFHHLSTIVDDIWYYAGDRSADMSWYTKRASLATIYSATELYMSQDISPEYVETYKFLDRRLNDAECLGATTRQLGTMLSFGAKSFMGTISQLR
ncbi:COQ9-domain-containing protein [Cunninghamella echinulata]|nr:COQ9-domain-containing protein [Cunninghamella echinulata]